MTRAQRYAGVGASRPAHQRSDGCGAASSRLRSSGYLGSCNIRGGKLFHVMSGNLSHQIEHHLFPDMCSNRYPEVAPRVRALAARYGPPVQQRLAPPSVRHDGVKDRAAVAARAGSGGRRDLSAAPESRSADLM